MNDPLLARLAAANPVPSPAALAAPTHRTFRLRLAAALASLAIAVPAVAFADTIAGVLGISNSGTPVATSDTPFTQVSGLNAAMQELGFPSTLQLLGQRDGISFYIARNAGGHYCFAIDAGFGKGVGCDLNDPGLAFPSARRPIMDFSASGRHVAGFAADGIASVALLDANGATLATVPVDANVYALADPPAGGVAVEALDAQGDVVYTHRFGEAP